ncbi:MAG: hypothetical protein JO250_20335 [Armatimonadetes bacterium]|nr:hypothetical protein [Armatimonadota bacterium]
MSPEFSEFRRWLTQVVSGSSHLFLGFELSQWAKAAGSSLAIVVFAAMLQIASPLISKALVGLCVVVYSPLVFVLLMMWGCWVAALVGRRLGKIAEVPPAFRESIRKTGDMTGLAQLLLFWFWGIFYLAGKHYHLFNRVALLVWIVTFLAGCLVAVVNGFGVWIRSRGHTPPGNV